MKDERFFLDQSESSDWYLIPVSKRKEWAKWRDTDETGEQPSFASYVNSASDVTFEKPKVK